MRDICLFYSFESFVEYPTFMCCKPFGPQWLTLSPLSLKKNNLVSHPRRREQEACLPKQGYMRWDYVWGRIEIFMRIKSKSNKNIEVLLLTNSKKLSEKTSKAKER